MSKSTVVEKDHAREQAKAQLESIIEMVDELNEARDAENVDDNRVDEAQQAISDDPLSVEVRSRWVEAGSKMEPDEFCILLCTGGPAVRILGDLDQYKQPSRAWIQYQDWGTPWTDYVPSMDSKANEKLLTYCQQFYFGD